MKNVIIVIQIMLLAGGAFGQDTSWLNQKFTPVDSNSFENMSFSPNYDSVATIGNKSFNRYLMSYFEDHADGLFDTAAIYGMIWTKFQIDQAGNLVHVECDPTVLPILKAFVLQMLNTTNGQWDLKRPKSQYRPGMTIILPIHYSIIYDRRKKPTQPPPANIAMLNYFLNRSNQQALLFLPVVDLRHVYYR